MAARDAMEALGFPYYPMGGNHDFVGEESRRWFIDAYKHRLPQARTHYAFQHRNLRFIVLDPWWLWRDGTLHPVSEASVAANMEQSLAGARWALPPQQLEWLAETLDLEKAMPTILSLHYPLVPIPARLLRSDTRNGGFLENGQFVLELLREYPQVKAVFSGHVHVHFIARAGTVTQVTTAALPEYPCEYREVQVFDDRLEVFTHPLSDASFAQRSLLPGREYTRGAAEDRRATIQF
jgi:3',5'-cyclic AMP phosphodiesterase CpdA